MTFRKSSPLLWFALPLALVAASCQKNAAEEAEAAAPATPAATTVDAPTPVAAPTVETRTAEPAPPPVPVPGTDAAIIEDHSTPTAAAPSFDAKAFDGRYASGDTMLEINADGTYVLNSDGNTIDGNWTLQAGGKKAILDPNSKGDADRKIDILSNDSVKIVGGATLKRQADAK